MTWFEGDWARDEKAHGWSYYAPAEYEDRTPRGEPEYTIPDTALRQLLVPLQDYGFIPKPTDQRVRMEYLGIIDRLLDLLGHQARD